MAQVFGHVNLPAPLVSDLRPDLPRGLDAVVAMAMAKDPAQRHRSATELAGSARQALSGHGGPAIGSPTTPQPGHFTATPPGRRRARTIVASVLAVAALVAAAVVVIPPLVSGAGSGTPDPAAGGDASAFPAGTTMARIAAAGTMAIGTKFDQPLYGLRGVSGDPEGFEVELAKIIAAELGIAEERISWVEMPSTDRELAAEEGRVDVVMATYTINRARRERVSFAGPYLLAGHSLMVRRENTTIGGPDDLRGQAATVCSVVGSTPAQNILGYIDPAQLVLFDRYSECADALQAGQVDVVTTDNVILAGFAANSGGAFTVVGDPFTEEPYGIGIARGDVAFCEFLNTTLARAADANSCAQAWALTAGVVSQRTPTLPVADTCT